MKSLFALIIILTMNPVHANSNSYSYCNVFIGTVCFVLGPGDEYQYTSHVDFRTYEIILGSRDEVIVYSGYHPAKFDYEEAYLVEDSINGYIVSASKIQGQHHRILIKPSEGRIPTLDIYIPLSPNDDRVLSEFIRSFKSCTRTVLKIACEDESLLQGVQL